MFQVGKQGVTKRIFRTYIKYGTNKRFCRKHRRKELIASITSIPGTTGLIEIKGYGNANTQNQLEALIKLVDMGLLRTRVNNDLTGASRSDSCQNCL